MSPRPSALVDPIVKRSGELSPAPFHETTNLASLWQLPLLFVEKL